MIKLQASGEGQACTTYGPQATCGPRELFLRPA